MHQVWLNASGLKLSPINELISKQRSFFSDRLKSVRGFSPFYDLPSKYVQPIIGGRSH